MLISSWDEASGDTYNISAMNGFLGTVCTVTKVEEVYDFMAIRIEEDDGKHFWTKHTIAYVVVEDDFQAQDEEFRDYISSLLKIRC